MTGFRVDLDTGDSARRLRGLAVALTDLRPFWPTARPVVVGWFRSQYDSQGAWSGDPWAPLSARYAAWKRRAHPGRPLLVLTGAMRRATLAPDATYEPTSMTLTVRDDKARYHQAGTRFMPARPLIPARVPAAAELELRQAAERYIQDTIRRWGFA